MKKNNSLFLIGTLGMLTTAIFNILLDVIVSDGSAIFSFSILYPVFIVFLLLGAAGMVRNNKSGEPINS